MSAAGLVAYVGGAAATVGAGVVVGLAVAAPAVADDSAQDSGRRATVEHASSTRHGAVRGGQAVARAPRPAAVVGRAVRAVPAVPEPSSKTVGLLRHSTLSREDQPPAVSSLPAAATSAVTVTPPTPFANTPTLPVSATPARAASPESPHNLYLDPRGQRVTFLKGTHFAIPGRGGLFIKQMYGTGTFTADSAYDLKGVDQYDWNKFSGIAFSPLQPDKNSAMVGWRYNLDTGEYEIAPFYNVNKQRILPNEQTEVISVAADATFHYRVDYSGVTVSYGDKTVFKPYPSGLTPSVWTASRVSGWFGGNQVAPRTLSYYLSFNWW